MPTPVRIAVVGAGARGTNYARLAARGEGTVSAVAEPDPQRRRMFAEEFSLPDDAVFTTWEDLLAAPRISDAVVIATQDRAHSEPAIAFARAGYDILLEKPMAPTEAESELIVDAVEESRVIMAVGHVMRYSDYTRELKRILDAGTIGKIVSIEHLEPIGWWHFAHSYVRGNWRREASSSSMLMAKSSHDLDWLSYISGRAVTKVSSFGGLYWFRPENKPAAATDRCVTCPLQDTCAYSATKIYGGFLDDPAYQVWPLQVITPSPTKDSVRQALEDGPYGECVYNGQNDVADHQVVNLEFDDGSTASFTAVAFTQLDFRKTRIFGTAGSIEGDGQILSIFDFATGDTRVVDTMPTGGASAADGHGGADGRLVESFLRAVSTRDTTQVSSARESFGSHRLVWAAERSRELAEAVTV
ncbi:Gfo/Idh/MocA family protein [Microbacterium sp. ZW T6_19]|uniref:Gfo/Idh/MocA family protein n=1 Tax=Microbacterium sp. ZW T6_19 TaxID=3378082 RepID=UPI003851BE96